MLLGWQLRIFFFFLQEIVISRSRIIESDNFGEPENWYLLGEVSFK
jgi:hypothetical protein